MRAFGAENIFSHFIFTICSLIYYPLCFIIHQDEKGVNDFIAMELAPLRHLEAADSMRAFWMPIIWDNGRLRSAAPKTGITPPQKETIRMKNTMID